MAGMMGMMGREGMMSGRLTDAEAKKQIKTLTRTDFLLQFVWKPVKPEDLPKTDEEQKTKVKELVDKMVEAQKNHPAVTIPKLEDIQAASLKKSKEIDSQLEKALSPGGAPGTPGFGPAAPGAGTPGVPPGGVPNQGGARPPAK